MEAARRLAMDDNRQSSRLRFVGTETPEEWALFKRGAKALLLDELTLSAKEKRLKTMLGAHPLAIGWPEELTANYGEITTPLALLEKVFGNKSNGRAEDDFHNLRQRSKGVSEHILEFHTAASMVTYDDAEKMRTFVNSLSFALKSRVSMMRPRDLADAIECARQQEPLIPREQRGTGKGKPGSGGKPEKANKAVGSTAPEKRKFPGNCFNCDKPGHMKKDCKVPVAKKATEDKETRVTEIDDEDTN